MEQLNFKVLKNGFENNIIAPAKGDAGWDLVASSDPIFVFANGKSKNVLYVEYDTGVVIQPPEGFYTLLFPRSSISKYTLALANSVGVIDAGYRNSIKLRFRLTDGKKVTKNSILYKKGDKIGQIIFTPMFQLLAHQTESLESSDRGLSGFGERTGS
jgi:deoxyuridine 5'-triphosphate nucleotidohydrolase